MIIKSRQKIDSEVKIELEEKDDPFHLLEGKVRIKYIGVGSMKRCPSSIIYLMCALESQEIMVY